MGHTYTVSLFHCVFSTRHREPLISPEMRERLWPFIGGIARENKIKPLEVGGYSDHAHMLLWVPATMAISKAMQLIKSGSSKFVHETFARVRGFEWQEGYGAFSIGVSDVDKTIGYIKRQEEHHRVKTLQEEYIGCLKELGIENPGLRPGLGSIAPPALAVSCETAVSPNDADESHQCARRPTPEDGLRLHSGF